jgi:hypothetical protein
MLRATFWVAIDWILEGGALLEQSLVFFSLYAIEVCTIVHSSNNS